MKFHTIKYKSKVCNQIAQATNMETEISWYWQSGPFQSKHLNNGMSDLFISKILIPKTKIPC